MHISEIHIRKFRHLENETLGPFKLSGRNSEVIVIAGPNGSGKSSILELIGYALSNSYSLNWRLGRTFSDFSFEIGILLSAEEKRIILKSVNDELDEQSKQVEEELVTINSNPLLNAEQKRIQSSRLKDRQQQQITTEKKLIEYFEHKSLYYRAFNYTDGEYEKDSTLQNQIHSIVTRELKDVLKRSLGFFLKSDRHYPQKSFERSKIFSFHEVIKKEHLWSMAFNTSEIQYQDMYEFLVQQRFHYLRELGDYYNKKNKGLPVGIEPSDPIKPYEQLLNRLFPDYKFADADESVPSNLFVELPTKEVITFNDLSSGEKEVFFILSFFIRHNVEKAIVVIDEPELHLHPELSRQLIRNMRTIREGNQIWVATHNSEIIDEAGRDKVIYAARDITTRKAHFINGLNEQAAISQLKDLFGFSGYIGVARNLVFLEGDNSSQDRKFFSTLFPEDNSSFKLVPVNSSSNLNRLNSAVLSIMEANLGWMKFYLIRDRDYLTPEMIEKYRDHSSGNMFVLSKHELENYLINFDLARVVLKDIFGIDKSLEEIESAFFETAKFMSSSVIRDMVAFRLNLLLSPQDFSLGKVMSKEEYFSTNEQGLYVESTKKNVLSSRFISRATNIRENFVTSLSQSVIEDVLEACENEVKMALESKSWIDLFPGKELLVLTAKKFGISHSVSFQNSLIKELASNRNMINQELVRIFDTINSGI